MTGFASVGRDEAGQRASVTVKSVNHRFLDVQVKMPGALGRLDAGLKALVQRRMTRGRVEIQLSWDQIDATAREVVLNEQLLGQINAAVDRAREQGLVTGALSASDLCRIPHVLEVRAAAEPDTLNESAVAFIEGTLGEALDALVVMRETEGRFLAADLDNRLATLLAFVDTVEQAAAAGQSALEGRLRDRLAALPADVRLDPTAVTQEVVRFVARSDIDEEVSRMRGHVEHWRQLADGPEPCGRKLDFLVQEMNREINTIGSKAEGLKVTEQVVAAKAELERVREQVQNVE
ncbi:MAG TPA: YicC/YloC family endoribonuclease [Vicinamibacterales bacterium]|nr:YicC/YloC family endoribonuclease [Vicinamibacterales bacterium]